MKKKNICPLSGEPCNYEKNFHITETVDGNYRTYLLCGKCAKPFFEDEKPTLIEEIESPEEEIVQEINISNPADMLQAMMQLISDSDEITEVKNIKKQNTVCPNCNTNLDKIAKSGKLGCTKCFEFFGQNLIPFINPTEQEKKTLTIAMKRQIFETYLQRLKLEIIQSIKNEDYEQVEKLKKQLKKAEIVRKKRDGIENKIALATQNNDQEIVTQLTKNLNSLIDAFLATI